MSFGDSNKCRVFTPPYLGVRTGLIDRPGLDRGAERLKKGEEEGKDDGGVA